MDKKQTIAIPESIKFFFDCEPSIILWSDEAERFGKWNVIEFGSMGGKMQISGLKASIEEAIGTTAFVKIDCSGRQGRAGWLAE